MRCQVFGSPSATVSNAKPPAMLISASSLPKCAAAASIAFLAARRIGQVDAAEFDLVRRCRYLRRRVVDAGHPRAARQRRIRDHPAERAEAPVTTMTFPFMMGLRAPVKASAHYTDYVRRSGARLPDR